MNDTDNSKCGITLETPATFSLGFRSSYFLLKSFQTIGRWGARLLASPLHLFFAFRIWLNLLELAFSNPALSLLSHTSCFQLWRKKKQPFQPSWNNGSSSLNSSLSWMVSSMTDWPSLLGTKANEWCVNRQNLSNDYRHDTRQSSYNCHSMHACFEISLIPSFITL